MLAESLGGLQLDTDDFYWLPANRLFQQKQERPRPAGELLFKAKHRFPKDRIEFVEVARHLSDEAKRWLANALEVAHPDCPWAVGAAIAPSQGTRSVHHGS